MPKGYSQLAAANNCEPVSAFPLLFGSRTTTRRSTMRGPLIPYPFSFFAPHKYPRNTGIRADYSVLATTMRWISWVPS
jgi:hypothetical protein